MIFDLLNDLNQDCNFCDNIKESQYTENSENSETIHKTDNDISANVSSVTSVSSVPSVPSDNSVKQYYNNFIKCIICEFDPFYSTLGEDEKKHYLSQKIIEICSHMDEKDESFKNYNFHKSMKSHNIQQGLQMYMKRDTNISSIYYLNEYFKRHFIIVHQNIAYKTCLKNYPKIYLKYHNDKVSLMNESTFETDLLQNVFSKIKLNDDIKKDLKSIYKMYLEPISKYKVDDLKTIAEECNISLKEDTKNKNKSVLYDEINMYKLNE